MRKEHKSDAGGLTAKGRKFFNAQGMNLKPPVSKGTNPRRVAFAGRFGGMKGPLVDKNGKPTRLKKALKRWGFGSKEAARNFAQRHKKA